MTEPPLPPVLYSLEFTKTDADALFSCLDVTLKSAGLPACQAVSIWADKLRAAMASLPQDQPCAGTPRD